MPGIRGVGVIEGIVDSASSVVKLWSGGWSDRIGSRKGLVLLGYALAAVTRPLIGFITAPWQLLAIRLADRIGRKKMLLLGAGLISLGFYAKQKHRKWQ